MDYTRECKPHISLFYRVEDQQSHPPYQYGGMVAFHAYPEGKRGLKVQVHKNGAYDELIEEVHLKFSRSMRWRTLLKAFRLWCDSYVRTLPLYGAPLLDPNNDPELERLLKEEEEIERRYQEQEKVTAPKENAASRFPLPG